MRSHISGIQIPSAARVNIDGELTLDSQAGTSGQFLISQGGGNTPIWSTTLTSSGTSIIPLTIKGIASQSANLTQWQDSTSAILAKVDSVGAFTTNSANGYSIAGAAAFKSLNSGQTMLLTAGSTVSTNPHVVIRQSSSQTGNLTEWQTSTPTTVASVSASGAFTASGDITAGNNLRSSYSSGDEGGQIFLNKAATNTTLTSGVNIDIYQNKLRFWEDGGNNRGFYIDMTTGANSVGSNLVGSGSYTLPTATSTALGGVELFSDTAQTVAANAVSATASRTYGLQLNAALQGVVNVPWTDTVYTLPAATTTALGGIELFDGTVQSTAANAVTTTASRTYGLQVNAAGQAVVNVPWTDTDTNTTYTLASGTNNGTLKLTPSSGGVQDNIAVTGLGTAAYTASSAYATSGHAHGNISNTGTTATTVTATNPLKVVIADSGGAIGLLTTTNASATTFLRGDGTWSSLTAAAGTLTGTTLNSTVTASSLTSVGTLVNLTVTNTITGSITGNAGTVTSGVYTTGTQTIDGVKSFVQPITINAQSTQFPTSLTIVESTNAVSRRAGINLGNNAASWTVGQDQSGSGTRDFFIYGNSAVRLSISPSGVVDVPGSLDIGGGGGGGGSGVSIGSTGTIAADATITAGSNITFSGKGTSTTEQVTGYHLNSAGWILPSRTGGTPLYSHRFGASGTVSMLQFLYNGATNGTINVASGGTPAFASGSDYRMKTDIVPITDALERMKNAKAYTFYKIDEVDPSDTLHTGFLAHELADVQPDAVLGEKDAVDEDGKPVYQEVMEAKIIPVMAQAINDLIRQNELLIARIEALENN